jgi:preprotein translocase subunit SecE
MARAQATSLWSELVVATLYKRNQGKLVRQLTAGAIFLTVALGAYAASQTILLSQPQAIRFGIPAAVGALGAWVAFRLVNHPPFAEFLIAVDGEMNKVTWASRGEVYRATIVVLATMLLFGVVLYVYDLVWMQLLWAIGVLRVI